MPLKDKNTVYYEGPYTAYVTQKVDLVKDTAVVTNKTFSLVSKDKNITLIVYADNIYSYQDTFNGISLNSNNIADIEAVVGSDTTFDCTMLNTVAAATPKYSLAAEINKAIQKDNTTSKLKTTLIRFDNIDVLTPCVMGVMTFPVVLNTANSATVFHKMLNTIPSYKFKGFSTLASAAHKKQNVDSRLFNLYTTSFNEIQTNLSSIGITASDITTNNHGFDLYVKNEACTQEIDSQADGTGRDEIEAISELHTSKVLNSGYAILEKVLLSMPLSAVAPASGDPLYDKNVKQILTLWLYARYIYSAQSNTFSWHKKNPGVQQPSVGYLYDIKDFDKVSFGYFGCRIPTVAVSKICSKVTKNMINSYMFDVIPPTTPAINTPSISNSLLSQVSQVVTVKDIEKLNRELSDFINENTK
jgi:hypothetical protein